MLQPVTHGHVYPLLPLIRELVSRGTRVSFFSPPMESVAEEVRAVGGEPYSYESIYRFKETDDEPRSVSWAAYPQRIMADAIHAARELEAPLRALRPDVIAHDFMCAAGRILGHALGLPTVALFPTYPTNERFPQKNILPLDLPPGHPERVQFQKRVQEISGRWGLPEFSDDAMFVPSSLLNVVFMPREFHPAGDSFDERYVFVGPSFGPRVRPTVPVPPRDRSRPFYYVTLGTAFANQPKFFRLCLEALSSLDGNVLLSIGNQVDPASLGPIPENATVASFVSQLDVLPGCTVFVNHAGMNSVMESLHHGVPMVVVPQIPEQVCTAKVMTDAKLGVALDPRVSSVDVFRDAVASVARDVAIAENVRKMQQIIRATNAPRDAATAILGALS